MFGNPTLNGQELDPDAANNANNYLIEKPQYSLSYNESNKGSNWCELAASTKRGWAILEHQIMIV
jgi:hypothetical protein